MTEERSSATLVRARQSRRRRTVLAAALVFVTCFLASYGLARYGAVAPSNDVARPPGVGARGPGAAPSFIPRRPAPGATASEPTSNGLEAANLDALAAEAEAREQALRAAIFGLGDDPSVTIETRLDRYRSAIEKALEDAGLEQLLAFRGVLIEAFLRNEAVQAELAGMPPGERQSQIDRIRAEFGYDEAALARMREIDARRDERWARGLAYMQERARLEQTFEGEVLDDELRHLREAHFGREAPTIEREEQAGFFRYQRPRVYGRN